MTPRDKGPEQLGAPLHELAQATVHEAAQRVRDMVMAEIDALPVNFPMIEVMKEVTSNGEKGRIAISDKPRPTQEIPGLIVESSGLNVSGEAKSVVLTPWGLVKATGYGVNGRHSRLVLSLQWDPFHQNEQDVLWLSHGPKAIKCLEDLKSSS